MTRSTTPATRSVEIPVGLYSNLEECARHYAEKNDLQNGMVPVLEGMINHYVGLYPDAFIEKEGDEWSESQYVFQGEGPSVPTEGDNE